MRGREEGLIALEPLAGSVLGPNRAGEGQDERGALGAGQEGPGRLREAQEAQGT